MSDAATGGDDGADDPEDDRRADGDPTGDEPTPDDPTPDDRFAPAVDCHVHLMPERLVAAIRGALTDEAGWRFPHPSTQGEMERTLQAAGVERYCALPYAHKPDVARELNEWVLDRAATAEMVVPFATVHGDDEVREVVREAFEAGARGLKFQCPVQRVAPDDPRLDPAYELAAEYDRPILFHGGTAPMFEDSPHVGVERFRSFVDSYPEVRACCAHMGTFETDAFVDVLAANDNVFLDTCFAMSSAVGESMAFDPSSVPDAVFEEHSERIMYGSDYPNIPHSYRSEREHLLSRDLPTEVYRDLFHDTAERFLGER